MKKLTLIALLFSLFNQLHAQGWVDIGIKGVWGPTFLYNQKVFDDNRYNHQITTKGGFGGKVGFNFNTEHEITFDFMVGGLSQDFSYSMLLDSTASSAEGFSSNLSYNSFDFLLMYRNNNDGKYFEVGPVLSNIRKVNRSDSYYGSGTDPNFSISDINSLQYGLSFGFGAYFLGSDNFGVTGGLRISYLLSDLINNNQQVNQGYPFGEHYVMNSGYNGTAAPTSSASHPLLVQLVFEANLDFAYLARANCGRTKLLMF